MLLDILGFKSTMECNKEEAVRAKEIAENRMRNGDFMGAQRIAVKARQLYPDLDNISQLLMVCEVHCSAQNKLNGSEMDWYGILQIEQLSDESVIKKQFRKLALSLHPDKNKFSGAEAAFKLISEANRVLTDPTKRSQYDMKCRIALKPVAPKPAPDQCKRNFISKKQHGTVNNCSNAPHSQNMSSHTYQQSQQLLTFWTICPSCNIRYQYFRNFVNKMLRCQNCHQPFIARDVGTSLGSSWSQFVNEKRVPSQDPSKVVPQNNAGKFSGMGFSYRSSGSDPVPKVGKTADVGGVDNSKELHVGNASGIGATSKPEDKVNGHMDMEAGKSGPEPVPDSMKPKQSETSESASSKRCRQSVDKSTKNFEKGNHAGSEREVVIGLSAQKSRPSDGHQWRRSSRQNQHISYKNNLSDDDFVVPSQKRSKGNSSTDLTDGEMKEASAASRAPKEDISAGFSAVVNNKEAKQKASSNLEKRSSNKKCKTGDCEAKGEEASMSKKSGVKLENNDEKSKNGTSYLNSNEALKAKIFHCPDPDFNNFEKDKADDAFAVHQVWAVYDDLDGMPRYYARVRKVLIPGFKLQVTWLEPMSNDKYEQLWCDEDLPVACGSYKSGGIETVDRLMFSHQMYSMNAGQRGNYLIYPKKGETWALFDDWDVKWSSEPEKHRPPYQFKFVEVVTDFCDGFGIGVAYLKKVKGFVSIFEQSNLDDVVQFCIKPNELYRFSHRVPSFKMTGQEAEGVSAGSFELDTAALPANINNLVDLGDVKATKEKFDAEAISKSSEYKVEPVKGSRKVCLSKNSKSGPEKGTSAPRSPMESTEACRDDNQVDAGQAAKEDSNNVSSHAKLTQPEGMSTSVHSNEKVADHKPWEKNKFITDPLTPRRSPRDLSKRSSQSSTSQSTMEDINKHTRTNKDQRDGQAGASSCQPGDKMHLHVKDGGVASPKKGQKVIEIEHYDFKKDKSEDKFQVDQIWALHNDKDGLPKKYGQVKKIECSTSFKLHVAMLEACSLRKDMMQHASCGTFKVMNKPLLLPITAFSHQVNAKPVGKNRYEIYPRQGEIWAVYKSWNAELKCPDICAGGCDFVEVIEDNDSGVKAVVLLSKPVYRTDTFFVAPIRSKRGTIDIPRIEFARFSHQCLAARHVREKDSCQMHYWELDTSSIPGSVIFVD